VPDRDNQTATATPSGEGQARLETLFTLMNGWSAALAGQAELPRILDQLRDFFDGSSAAICRVRESWAAPRLAARVPHEAQAGVPHPGLADIVLTKYRASAVPGTIWRLSELRDEPGFERSAAGRELARSPDTGEISLVVLANGDDAFDYLLLTYRDAPRRDAAFSPEMVARSLADAWALRRGGIVAQMIVSNGRRRGPAADPLTEMPPILSDSNPYGLTRSEFRVCHMVEAGMKAPRIAEELGLAEATIRSHLRAIYAKTGASGQLEVMSRLRAHARPDGENVVALRRASA